MEKNTKPIKNVYKKDKKNYTNNIKGYKIQVNKQGKSHKLYLNQKKEFISMNLDDYRYYHYNYDGAGFMITIDPGSLPLTEEFYGRNAVFVEYRSGIIRGKRILRGIKSSLHEQLLRAALHTDQFSLHFELDQRDTLFVICGQEI